MPAPRRIVPPGYNPALNRTPQKGNSFSCLPLVLVLGLLLVVGAGGVMAARAAFTPATAAPRPTIYRTETATITPTLDAWAMTGTAMMYITASATLDYCFWLTPTGTFTPTLEHTPDEWSATGTAAYEATYPPQTATHTPDVPRVWCNNIPTVTPTFTRLAGLTTTATAIPPTETSTPLPTNTQPPPPPNDNGGGSLPGMPTPPPDVLPTFEPPTVAPPTIAPTKTKKPKKTVTATITPQARLMSRITTTPTGD